MITKHTRPTDPWEALAYAIVDRAVTDYRYTLRQVVRKPTLDTTRRRHELERFFRSFWFEALTDMDGSEMMERVRRQVGLNADEA